MAEPDTSLLRDPLTFRDPYPVYETLRPHSPLQVSRSSWILLSYEHVRAALADPERFSSNVRGSDNPVFRDSPLIFDDPPRHTQIRRIMTKAFTPKRVAEAEPWIREIADGLLDDIGRGVVDFQLGYCDPLARARHRPHDGHTHRSGPRFQAVVGGPGVRHLQRAR